MLPNISLEEAQAKLPEIIGKLGPGEEVVITKDDRPVAKLVSQQKAARQPPQAGSAKGMLIINVEDEEHLEDFKEYMPCGFCAARTRLRRIR
jgi:antitoxin (DNA-binding transcriptional repressor) of toxin-antitoxin stability system